MFRLVLALAMVLVAGWTIWRLIHSQVPDLSVTGAPPLAEWPAAPASAAASAGSAADEGAPASGPGTAPAGEARQAPLPSRLGAEVRRVLEQGAAARASEPAR